MTKFTHHKFAFIIILNIIKYVKFYHIVALSMKFIRHICIIFLCVFSLLIMNFGHCLGNLRTFDRESTPQFSGVKVITGIDEWSKNFTDNLEWILHMPQKYEYETSLWYALALITIAVNWILWMLAFVALVYMIFCGFLVLSSDDKNASKVKKWIYTAAIALAWIWLAWLIISAMVWFIESIS